MGKNIVTPKQREKLEKMAREWLLEQFRNTDKPLYRNAGNDWVELAAIAGYLSGAQAGWEMGRVIGLEEAAKEAERSFSGRGYHPLYREAASAIANYLHGIKERK